MQSTIDKILTVLKRGNYVTLTKELEEEWRNYRYEMKSLQARCRNLEQNVQENISTSFVP